jgi:hypothetical protein
MVFPTYRSPPAPKNALSAQAGNNNNNVVRNPKKRSRAYRRAPTVLTTDTTNFRAMVHEFFFLIPNSYQNGAVLISVENLNLS